MFAKKSTLSLAVLTIISITALLMMAGCSSKSTIDETSDNTPDAITLTSSTALIASSGTAVIDAAVTMGGTGVVGQVVSFSCTPVGAGSFVPTVDTTDGTGSAATVFTPTIAGYVTITASVGGTTLTSSINVEVLEGSTSDGTVSMTPTRTQVLANGADTSWITIEVNDTTGTPAPDGTTIKLVSGERFTDVNGDGSFSLGVDILDNDANGNGVWDAIGTIQATADVIGGAGQVSIPFVSGIEAATAYLRATVNENGIEAYAQLGISVTANGATINVTTSTSDLVANGSDQTVVTATLRDALGNVLANGTTIRLIAGERFTDVDGNGVWSVGVDNLVTDANSNGLWDAVGTVPATVDVAGGAGQASFTYTAGTVPQTVYIKMTVSDPGISGSTDLALALMPDTNIASIFLMTDSIQISVTQTGGMDIGTIYATGFDARGSRVGAGVPMDFNILRSPGGGVQFEDGTTGPFRTYTDVTGVAKASIQSGTTSGTVTIRVSSGTVLSAAAQILISAGPPAYIVIGAAECNVPWWDNVGFENEIVAVVADQYLNPVNDSTVVYFSTDEGTMKSHEERTKENEGVAHTIWIAGTNVPTADGIVWIYAETDGGNVLDSSFFYNSHLAVNFNVFNWQATLLADGESFFIATLEALDFNGNPVEGGTKFEAEASLLTASGGSFEDGCVGATARSKVTSKTLREDGSLTGANDDGIGGIGQVQYYVDPGGSFTQTCTLLTGKADRRESSIFDFVTSASIGEVVVFGAQILDSYGNPLGDHTLNATASGGVIAGASQETDRVGEAWGFTWTAPGIGDYTITITDTDPRGLITLTAKVTVE